MASKLRRDISSLNFTTNGSTATDSDNLECDVLIVGAGFGGVYLLHRLRDEFGLNAKVYEAGKNLGSSYTRRLHDFAKLSCRWDLALEYIPWSTRRLSRTSIRVCFREGLEELDLDREISRMVGTAIILRPVGLFSDLTHIS